MTMDMYPVNQTRRSENDNNSYKVDINQNDFKAIFLSQVELRYLFILVNIYFVRIIIILD